MQFQDTTDTLNKPIPVTTTLNITVGDLDDLNPVFNESSYEASVVEEDVAGELTVSPAPIWAFDQDTEINENVTYSCKLKSYWFVRKL